VQHILGMKSSYIDLGYRAIEKIQRRFYFKVKRDQESDVPYGIQEKRLDQHCSNTQVFGSCFGLPWG
jgi:hypothetical protein